MARRAPTGLGEKTRLILIISVLIALGFGGSGIFAFLAARNAIRASIERDALPVAAESVYARLQKDLMKPIFVSSAMANDSFLHDWVEGGERDLGAIGRYLEGIRSRYGALTAFFVSERSGRYYYPKGLLKTMDRGDPRDIWYFRVRTMKEDYELNVDPDLGSGDVLTVFINYRAIDAEGRYLGAVGIGLAVDALAELVAGFRDRHGTAVYFADRKGRLIAGSPAGAAPGLADLAEDPAMAAVASRAVVFGGGSYAYDRGGEHILLNVSWVPELSWFLFVERPEGESVRGARSALYLNLGLCAFVLLLVVLAATATIDRFQTRLERMASFDPLTGAMNRLAFSTVAAQAFRAAERTREPLSVAMFDIDDFKRVNDLHGHPAGDEVLRRVVGAAEGAIRASDSIARWGGEEFLVLLPGCDAGSAVEVAEKLRTAVARASGGVAAGQGPEAPNLPPVSVSVGVAELRRGGAAERWAAGAEDFESLVRRADEALLEAKRAGKDRTVAAPPTP